MAHFRCITSNHSEFFLLLLKAAADEECKFDRYVLSFPTYKHLHGHLQYIR